MKKSTAKPEPLQQRIARLRHAAGLTQVELAARLGCPQSSVGRWETGVHPVSSRYLRPLATALGCEVGELL